MGTKRLCLIILLFFSIASYAHEAGDFVHVKRDGMTRTQLFEKITSYITVTYNAEIAYNDTAMVLAYVVYRPQNCVGVIYTLKFYIEDNEFSFAVYSAVTRKDNNDLCHSDVEAELKEIKRKIATIR
ncbi:MAG: hypothetical protein MJ197_08420 [Bacteroidales bacterium]|nr:hypothetical protein [Bacteroidales bacterium]